MCLKFFKRYSSLQSVACMMMLALPFCYYNVRGGGKQHSCLMVQHAAGNPWTDADIDNRGVVDFMWNHAVISDKAAGGCKSSLEAWSKANIKLSLATL